MNSLLYIDVVMFDFFFFSSRRRHTRFDCDWSSDVCSSDLEVNWLADHLAAGDETLVQCRYRAKAVPARVRETGPETLQIGRASWRGRGEISGVAVSLKKKKNKTRVQRSVHEAWK